MSIEGADVLYKDNPEYSAAPIIVSPPMPVPVPIAEEEPKIQMVELVEIEPLKPAEPMAEPTKPMTQKTQRWFQRIQDEIALGKAKAIIEEEQLAKHAGKTATFQYAPTSVIGKLKIPRYFAAS